MKPEHNPSLPSVVGKEQARWQPMELHGARLALWQAIRSIRIGNNTDDKLILEELRKQGVWLYCVSDRPLSENALSRGEEPCSSTEGTSPTPPTPSLRGNWGRLGGDPP